MTSIRIQNSSTGQTQNRKIKVLRVITRLNIGGPSIQAVSLTTRLKAFGCKSLLVHGSLSPGEGDMAYLLAQEGVEALKITELQRSVNPTADLVAACRLYRILRIFKPDIIHTHTAKAGAIGRIVTMLYNLVRGRNHPVRMVHTYHGHVFDGYFGKRSTAVFLGLERWLARRTDRIIAISPRIADEIVGRYKIGRPEQVCSVRLGFHLTPFLSIDDNFRRDSRAQLDVPNSKLIVTTVGRLTEIKKHDLFLEMAHKVLLSRQDVLFLIVGDGELREELESMAVALGLEAVVRFLGWRQDLSTIYAASDLFVLTSRNEGTPVALIEAMASGLPGVSTDVGGVRDVITNPSVGDVVPFGAAEDIARSVLSLLSDDHAERRLMGEQARDVVSKRFRVERLVEEIADLYEKLIDKE
tara:strand:+ start:2890 stop:4125 length:1236 start_codon:yes stop_codon:yes gene_type:complete